MVNKLRKRCLTTLAVREIKIKTILIARNSATHLLFQQGGG
jgi:hypothetical protein